MNLTRLLCRVVLIAFGCTSIWAQIAPLTPSPVAPKPFQFDASQYKLLLPNRPATLRRTDRLTTALRVIPDNKPCAVARIVRPNPSIDPQMIPHHPGSAAMPIEAHSRDITEMNVPAPSCLDIAAPQAPVSPVTPEPVPPPDPQPAR